MDVDAYVLANQAEWRRLDELSRRRALSAAEADELLDHYQRVATHLSVVRTQAPDAQVISYLSVVLARARNRAGGPRVSTWRSVAGFVTQRFPAALYRLRWWWLCCLAANVVVTAVLMAWLLSHPEIEQSMMSPEQIYQLVNHDFEDYYSSSAASAFAARVWVNNAWVSALCLAFGVLGLPVIWLLWGNISNLALVGSIMIRHDHGAHFWGLILPHGILELTAVFVAGGVGLKLFWSWIEPGEMTRTQSMAREGRTVGTVALGLVLVLCVSGMIEGFVTPSPLPTWARVGIGVVAELLFLGYVFVVGKHAYERGASGDIASDLLEDRVATAA